MRGVKPSSAQHKRREQNKNQNKQFFGREGEESPERWSPSGGKSAKARPVFVHVLCLFPDAKDTHVDVRAK